MEGTGAYTAVDGERTMMHPGDFIITPSWTWHDHGNPGTEPVVWMDGLDIQIVQLHHRIPMNTTYWKNWPTAENSAAPHYVNGAHWHLTFPMVLWSLQPA